MSPKISYTLNLGLKSGDEAGPERTQNVNQTIAHGHIGNGWNQPINSSRITKN